MKRHPHTLPTKTVQPRDSGEPCLRWGDVSYWPHAVQHASHVRNRCYNDRTENTPYFMLTGRKPNLSKMWVFGSDCYAYKHDHKKLDPRGERGIFVGHSKSSPAYLIYNPHTEKVSKHRLVKFIKRNSIKHRLNTIQKSRVTKPKTPVLRIILI